MPKRCLTYRKTPRKHPDKPTKLYSLDRGIPSSRDVSFDPTARTGIWLVSSVRQLSEYPIITSVISTPLRQAFLHNKTQGTDRINGSNIRTKLLLM